MTLTKVLIRHKIHRVPAELHGATTQRYMLSASRSSSVDFADLSPTRLLQTLPSAIRRVFSKFPLLDLI